MSRLTARRRWVMTGPWPHPKTGILYYRKATPPDIFAARMRLAELGIRVTREVQRSLKTRDQKPGERRYRKEAEKVEAEWDRWRRMVRAVSPTPDQHTEEPVQLTHRQRVALAADRAKSRLAQYEDEPFDAPSLPPFADLTEDDDAWRAVFASMTPEEQREVRTGLIAYLHAEEPARTALRTRLLHHHPRILVGFGASLKSALETRHGADTDAALALRGLTVDSVTRSLINLEMLDFIGAAHGGLSARQGGDYGPVKRLEAAPSFALPSSAPALPLEGLLDHKASTQTLKAKTVSDARSHIRKFVAFIGHDDARKVTREDVRKWRDALIAEGVLSPKTITDRYLSALKSVLAHGVKEFDLLTNPASDMKDRRTGPTVGPKGYTEDEAVKILEATLKGSTKALSEPHRRAIRWVPWILAYTGLRVTEVTQFRARHLLEHNGVPYLLITPEDGSTKGKGGGKAWMVGIHKHLIEMGLLEFLRSFGDGPVFYEPYPAGTEPASVPGKSRAQEAGVRVGKWVTDEVGITAPLNRPNHAWRHLFTTRSRQCDMDKVARDFMMGSGAGDAREGYGDWPPEKLDREINKLPRFKVNDLRQRP